MQLHNRRPKANRAEPKMIGDSNNQTERIGASCLLIADINRRETLKEMTYLDIVVAYDKTVGGMNSLLNYNVHLKSIPIY